MPLVLYLYYLPLYYPTAIHLDRGISYRIYRPARLWNGPTPDGYLSCEATYRQGTQNFYGATAGAPAPPISTPPKRPVFLFFFRLLFSLEAWWIATARVYWERQNHRQMPGGGGQTVSTWGSTIRTDTCCLSRYSSFPHFENGAAKS